MPNQPGGQGTTAGCEQTHSPLACRGLDTWGRGGNTAVGGAHALTLPSVAGSTLRSECGRSEWRWGLLAGSLKGTNHSDTEFLNCNWCFKWWVSYTSLCACLCVCECVCVCETACAACVCGVREYVCVRAYAHTHMIKSAYLYVSASVLGLYEMGHHK